MVTEPAPSPAPSLRERFQALNAATSREAAMLAAQGQNATLWGLIVTPFLSFLRVYLGQGACLRGTAGLVDAIFIAYEVFVRHAKLWEIQHIKNSQPPPPRS